MIFGEGKDEEIKKYVDGVFAKGGFLARYFQPVIISESARLSGLIPGIQALEPQLENRLKFDDNHSGALSFSGKGEN